MVSEFKIEIDRPLKDVYAAFANPENMPRWLHGLQRTEQIKGKPGQVGSQMRMIYLERGKTVELIETITAHEPMKYMKGVLTGPGIESAIHMEYVDRGDKTTVISRSEWQSKGIMMAIMKPFIKNQVRKRQGGDLQRFKKLMEAGELAG